MNKRRELFTKRVDVTLSPQMWKLLGMYLADVDQRAHEAGRTHTHLSLLIGGILTWYMSQCAESITEGFLRAKIESTKRFIPGLLSTDQLAAVEASSGSDIPLLVRKTTSPAIEGVVSPNAARARAVRGAGGRPTGAVLRSLGGPESLRGGSLGGSPTASRRNSQPSQPDPRREDDAGQRSAGLGAAEALIDWARRAVAANIERMARGDTAPDPGGTTPKP